LDLLVVKLVLPMSNHLLPFHFKDFRMGENSTLYVGNLNYKASFDDIKALFSKYGQVVRVKIVEKDGLKKGFAFVELDSVENATSAKNALNEQDFMGRKIRIDYALPKKPMA